MSYMKQIIVIILAAFLVVSCANSPSNENGSTADSLDVTGRDTSQGYNANSGNVNTQTGNTIIDSSRIKDSLSKIR